MADAFVQNAKSGKWECPKDDDAQLDYWQDWTAWLDAASDTLSGHLITLTPSDPLSNAAVVASMIVGKKIVAWISGGIPGETLAVAYRIFGSGSPMRIDERTCYLKIKER